MPRIAATWTWPRCSASPGWGRCSAIPWATLVGAAGYLFGALLTRHVAELHRIEHWIMALVLLLALALHGLA